MLPHMDDHSTRTRLHRHTMFLLILLLISISIDSHIYLYHTHDGLALEYYDCVLIQSLHYCRRPASPINLTRDHDSTICELNGGVLHRFSDLHSRHINTSAILYQWKSSIERIGLYSRYLTHPEPANDGLICQCIEPSSFGKDCEYRLPVGETLADVLQWRLDLRNTHLNQVQMHGDIVCYETLVCYSGLLCLDWREICDGVQHCHEANDEENCDVLEMNVCDDDEYRCMNGMCIPDVYFLDGEFDCMDWSDEIQYKKSDGCGRESASAQCDDHLCPPTEWSCGDGQCLPHRFTFRTDVDYATCENRRDQQFMCENHFYLLSWTMPNGRCHEGEQYEAPLLTNRTEEEQCLYLLRCTLSCGGEKNCPCEPHTSCAATLRQNCSDYVLIYPHLPLVTSHIWTIHNPDSGVDSRVKTPSFGGYGTLKCRQSSVAMKESSIFEFDRNIARTAVDEVCRTAFNLSSTDRFPAIQHCHRPHESTDVCDEWNPCMSITRLNDGFINCLNTRDESIETAVDVEGSCSHLRRYRLRCSISQPTCLSVMALGNGQLDCDNTFDERWFGGARTLSQLSCNEQRTDHCDFLRRYIEQSWTTADHEQMSLISTLSFRSHCDTFGDRDPPADENTTSCGQGWVCATDQESCSTKQCLDRRWVEDDEWDCSDAQDEREVFDWIVDHVRVRALSINISYPFHIFRADTCNMTGAFLCLSPHTPFPQFFCINQSQLGDGHIDCLGAIDEQNTLRHCSQSSLLGHHFLCASTNTCIPYYHHCQPGYRCPNRSDDEPWCSRLNRSTTCHDVNDFLCYDGSCRKHDRCNREFDCPYFEDEYMCDYGSVARRRTMPYRSEKQLQMRMARKSFHLPRLPPSAHTIDLDHLTNITAPSTSTSTTTPIEFSPSAHISAYRCNRGVGILSTTDDNGTICFCPPHYYGDRCQFHNDRLSVLVHLNLSQSNYTSITDPNLVLKLVLLFYHHNRTLMSQHFHIRPASEADFFKKHSAYFFYSHSSIIRQQRRARYSNRSDILHHRPYSLQIDLYQLRGSQTPSLIAVWRYPIHFDYLPVSRFSKVLHLKRLTTKNNPCSTHSCPSNAACHPLMNNHSQHICLCHSNYMGDDCAQVDQQCLAGHCAAGALCQANYRLQHRGNQHPLCICPEGRYGDRCHIDEDLCRSNPCLNGGTCFPSSSPDQLICLCTREYYGDRCHLNKRYIRLTIDTSLSYTGMVIQFFDIDFISLDLHLVYQQSHRSLPQPIEYYYTQLLAPNIILAKCYSSPAHATPHIYLLSLSTNVASIDGKTILSDLNHCHHIHQRFRDLSPIRYHSICRQDRTLWCFRDDVYLCICVDNHTRVECFIFDEQLDRCSHCLQKGRCLRGDRRRSADFVCLCPRCYSGRQCHLSSRSFTFTLDQLFFNDLTISSRRSSVTLSLLPLVSLLTFLLAMPNNLFSFVTFRQPICLRNGVGHYLLYLSLINQFNLGVFVARLTHLTLNITNRSSLNTLLCKLLNYLLVSSSRLVFWLSALIAIERVYMTLVLNGQWPKQPRIARRLLLFTTLIIFVSSAYELFFYQSLSIIDDVTQRSMCIFTFPQSHRSAWTGVHLFVSTLHLIVPFLINLCSTVLISVTVVKKKINTRRTKQAQAANCVGRLRFICSVLHENRELVIGPGLTLIPQLFSLPLFIASFTLDCQNIEQSWLRYLLIVSSWMTFTPQLISFFLYISPSSLYLDEWNKTKLRRWINSTLRRHSSDRKVAKSSTAFNNIEPKNPVKH